MADKVIISKNKLTAIGDAVREKTNSSETYPIDLLPEAIRNITSGNASTSDQEDGLLEKTLVNYTNTTATIAGQYIFTNQTKLEKVTLSNLQEIKSNAFNSCSNLLRVRIDQTSKICKLGVTTAFSGCYHILGEYHKTYNPNTLADGYILVPASKLAEYKIATNWVTHTNQIIGHQKFNVGDTLPNYTTSDFAIQTWYSDDTLTNSVTSITTAGEYYCKLEV